MRSPAKEVCGELYAIWILENQETVDYSMPVSILLREALEYDRHLDAETCDVIGKLIGTSQLRQQADKKGSEEEQDMCKALEDLREEGVAMGFIECCRGFGLAEKDIFARLQQKLNMTAQKAQDYLSIYEKQCI